MPGIVESTQAPSKGGMGPGTLRGRRMFNLGMTALLARKGITTDQNSKGPMGPMGPIQYIFRKVGKGSGDPHSFRLQPSRANFYGEESDYMKLRNYSFNVYKSNAESFGNVGKRNRKNEKPGAKKARRLWAGPGPGAYMKSLYLEDDSGAEALMRKQKQIYLKAGMDAEIKVLTYKMIASFIKVMSQAGTWHQVIKKETGYKPDAAIRGYPGQFGGHGGGYNKLGWGKTKSGGIPWIRSQSAEESMAYVADRILPLMLAGKEWNLVTGMKEAGYQPNIRPAGQRLDIHRDRQANTFKQLVSYILEKESKGQMEWANEEATRGWQDAIAGFDVTEQQLMQKYPQEWKSFQMTNDAKEKSDWLRIKAFIRHIGDESAKYGVKNAPRDTKTSKAGTEAGMAGQAARRLQDVKQPKKYMGMGKTESADAYMVTAPVGNDIALMYIHTIKGPNGRHIPAIVPGYIFGANDNLTGAAMKDIMGDEAYMKISSVLKDFSEKGYATWEKQRMQITYSESEKFLRFETSTWGNHAFTATMVTRGVAAKAIFEWVSDGSMKWFETRNWENLVNPSAMTSSFWLWFRMWIEKGRKQELFIDQRSGTRGWKTWIKQYVRPKYMREGGKRPNRREPGAKMMPYADEVRTWHPPLYVRPFILQDRSGLKAVYEKELRQLEGI
jgi:hypothetical protein